MHIWRPQCHQPALQVLQLTESCLACWPPAVCCPLCCSSCHSIDTLHSKQVMLYAYVLAVCCVLRVLTARSNPPADTLPPALPAVQAVGSFASLDGHFQAQDTSTSLNTPVSSAFQHEN